MKQRVLLLTAMAFLSACSSLNSPRSPANGSVEPRVWSQAAQDQEPYRFPYVSTFWNETKSLVFVAAGHRNSLEDPTFKTIKKIFEDQQFDLLIVEGFPRELGLNPERAIQRIEICKQEQYKSCGENDYAIRLAFEKGVPILPAEPSDRSIADYVKEMGISEIDLVYYYLVRQIPQWRMEGVVGSKKFQSAAISLLKKYYLIFGIKGDVSYDHFLLWFEEKSPNKNLLAIEYSDISIANDNEFGRLSAKILEFREKYIVSVVKESFSKFPRILIVYGSDHLTNQRPVWESYFKYRENKKLY